MAKKDEKTVKQKNKENKVKKHFFKDFKAELKKVIWPTPKQLVNNTVAVVTIVLITAVIVFALDVMFKAMNEHGITKLQSYVVDKFGEKTTTNTQSTDGNTAVESENNTNTEQE
jgi:preprotein translocase subunit SecE